MIRTKILGAVTAGAVALSMTGLAGAAAADPADDVAIMLENLPTAVEELVAGVQEAIDVLATTQSAVDTSAALGDALVAAGSALVNGTEQFGALGLGLTLVNLGVQQVLAPYLGAIDDPSTAAGLIDPEDISTLLANLPPAVDGLLYGDGFADGAVIAVAEALKGNLIFGPSFGAIGTPAFVGNAFNGAGVGLTTLVAGTSIEPIALPVAIILLVAAIGGADYIQQAEDALAPLFEALGPVTEPVVAALEGL